MKRTTTEPFFWYVTTSAACLCSSLPFSIQKDKNDGLVHCINMYVHQNTAHCLPRVAVKHLCCSRSIPIPLHVTVDP